MVHLPEDAPSPRLCVIEKSSPTQEYGYNLHAEKGRGQYVGMVDKNSPAEIGGLRMGDRIFAVNGHSIIGESHKKVVERIKENAIRCEMLVISEAGAQWYKEHGIEINMQLPNIQRVGGQASRRSTQVNGSPPPAAGWYAPSNKTSEPVFVAPPPPHEEPNMNKPRPRLCKLEKSSASEEFGFNLHAEKGRGHFIGTVDQGGIGDRAGLRMGQRIVGVNGVLVYPNTPHKEVVAQIKRSPLSTTLLVASEEVDKWYKENHAEFSFDYVEEEIPLNNQISPHSIQISDEEDFPELRYKVPPQSEEDERIEEEEIHEEEAQHGEPEPQEPEPLPEVRQPTSRLSVNEEVEELAEPEALNEPAEPAAPSDLVMDQFVPAMQYTAPVEVVVEPSEPETLEKVAELPQEDVEHRKSTHEGRDDTEAAPHYVPTYQTQRHEAPPTTQISPPSNGSSLNGYPTSNDSVSPLTDKFDIFGLSAQEARERIRQNKKNIHRGFDMSLEEKYRLVSNM